VHAVDEEPEADVAWPAVPPGLNVSSPLPNDNLANISSPPSSYRSSTLKSIDSYQRTVARMLGTRNIGALFLTELPIAFVY
jgi:hypothetical protein